MKTLKRISSILLLILIANFAKAQTNALIGSWSLSDKSQLSGTEYANAIPTKLQFSVTGTDLNLTRTEIAPDEDSPGATSTEKLLLEKGKAIAAETADKRKIITSASLDSKSLTEIKTISQPGEEKVNIRIKETSTLSDDGKTLTLVKEFENLSDANDKWSVKGTYTKQ